MEHKLNRKIRIKKNRNNNSSHLGDRPHLSPLVNKRRPCDLRASAIGGAYVAPVLDGDAVGSHARTRRSARRSALGPSAMCAEVSVAVGVAIGPALDGSAL